MKAAHRTLAPRLDMISNQERQWFLLAQEAARDAGAYLRHTTPQIVQEIGRDIKLDVDLAAEKRIREKLLAGSPHPILGEEQGGDESSAVGGSPYVWIVDPLDGSYNFSRGVPLCCVSVALFKEDKPFIGAIYDFNRDEMFAGIALGSASGQINEGRINGQVMAVSTQAELSKASLCTGTSVYSRPDSKTRLAQIGSFKKTRLFGTAALSLAWVACGRIDAYFEKDMALWDVAAGIALVEAAGGKVRWKYNPQTKLCDVLASNGRLNLSLS